MTACTSSDENGFVLILVLTNFGSYALWLMQNFVLLLMKKAFTHTHSNILTLQVC
ncbi:hypothetical protein HOLleu_25764 [Holothuria leucospilota]|uniref:Uncharacterized protein n=1 Tax=Holothuria leucospilota TaxID=206669 RepID=A0A9Q1H479_HOLLE|nr:hypothetical protein HOLleu_25764 [Holothuria leucospilota]